ncbi:MAG TPA: His/Gly/Thr/Pro-type tRNA ligase C-terminal domain-containing protein, partial [Clostridiales bacterium]|nr:His/Gly/Thr/Pro-type tRNA ligase C-terminal domain-containing protein [Clostridiales bacterium]
STALNCVYLDENGKEQVMIMGSYGIGVGRTMAAIIEQNYDEHGIIWPASVAPYHAIVVPVNQSDKVQAKLAEQIYNMLADNGIEVLIDDRDERPGVKFKDADLIGIPVRITVGRKAEDGIVEYKLRKSSEIKEIKVENILNEVKKAVGN